MGEMRKMGYWGAEWSFEASTTRLAPVTYYIKPEPTPDNTHYLKVSGKAAAGSSMFVDKDKQCQFKGKDLGGCQWELTWSEVSTSVPDETLTGLTGQLPEEYKRWTKLEEFKVHGNRLSGHLPTGYAAAWTELSIFSIVGASSESSDRSFENKISAGGDDTLMQDGTEVAKVETYDLDPFFGMCHLGVQAMLASWGLTQASDFCATDGITCKDTQGSKEVTAISSTDTTLSDGASLTVGAGYAPLAFCRKIETFDVSGSGLSGQLPKDFSAWGKLKTFDVSNNNLDGWCPWSTRRGRGSRRSICRRTSSGGGSRLC